MFRISVTAALVAASTLLTMQRAGAQVGESGYSLPLALAVEAATEAIHVCELHGYAVTASVVDTSGVLKLQAKGDHSSISTKDSSFRKAYTVVTFGPIFKFDTSGRFYEFVGKNPLGPGLASMPNVVALPGAVAIKRGDEIVAALGIGGAPGGEKDEVCAEAGVARIRDRVASAAVR